MSFRRRSLLAAAALALAVATPATAQQPAWRVSVGDRVRVSAPTIINGVEVIGSDRWKVGTVREVTAGAMVLQTDSANAMATISIPFDVVRRVEVSSGLTSSGESRRSGARRGAVIGAGMALAYVAVVQLAHDGCRDEEIGCEEDPYLDSSAGASVRNLAIGAAVGAALGALLGPTGSEVWIPATRRGMPGVSHSDPGATTIGFTLRL